MIKKINNQYRTLSRVVFSHSGLECKQNLGASGVYFIKVGRKVQIIEIALSKLGAWRKARTTPCSQSLDSLD